MAVSIFQHQPLKKVKLKKVKIKKFKIMKKIVFIFVIFVLACVNELNAQVVSFVEYGANSPIVNLTSNDLNDTICVGDGVIFSTPYQGSTQYEFVVGATTVQGPAMSNSYSTSSLSAGNYNVIVIADNGACSLSDTLPFVVLSLPTPTLSSDVTEACVGAPVTFTAGGGTYYNFRVNGTSVQSGSSSTYTYTSYTATSVMVDVIVGNAGGCTATSGEIEITIHPSPTITLVSDVGTSACSGSSVEFTATGGNNYQFRVDGLSAYSLSDTWSVSTLTNGQVVDVVGTDLHGCSAISAPIAMTVHPLPSITTISYSSAYSVATAECVNYMVGVTLQGLTGAGPYKVRIYDEVGGNPGTLFYTVPGFVNGPNGTFTKPIYDVGANAQFFQIEDQNGCVNFPTPTP